MKYSISYSTWTDADIAFGDTDNRGMLVHNVQYDAGDLDQFIRTFGYFEPSSSVIDEYTYFYTADPDINFETGANTETCLHFKDVTLASKVRIANYLAGGRDNPYGKFTA